MKRNSKVIEYYRDHSSITNPGEFAHLYETLPDSISEIVAMIQGIFLHVFWAERYGVKTTGTQKEHVQSRYISKILKIIIDMQNSPLNEERPLKKRFIGNCRDYAVFLCSILRHKGIPARARCGFAGYFEPPKYVDHWVCEYWNENSERWIMVDAQLDSKQKKALSISFDSLVMVPGNFLSGAEAWKMCREGKKDPELFGIFDMWGLWFVRGNLLRDLASLNKVELLPWDCWGYMETKMEDMIEEDYEILDTIADKITNCDEELYKLHDENPQLKVPSTIKSYTQKGVKIIHLDL